MSLWELSGLTRFYDRREGLVVCYCLESGDTHLISMEAYAILSALVPGPVEEATLRRRLLGEVPREDDRVVLAALLRDLSEVDLVVRL
ncbi:MAG: hypothetical protein ACK5HY_01180 [Parahaliea sp.]